MQRFIPKRVFFEPKALDYALGQAIYNQMQQLKVPIRMTSSHNRVNGIPGATVQEAYREAKRTLVVGVRKNIEFATCKPSAHYQLPLNTSCPGMCEYCYLATTLGKKPYIRTYVNIEEVLARSKEYISTREPELTFFEGAATSDPIPTEYITGLLQRTIEFFGQQPFGRFRFVTKFTDVDSLLDARHNGHTHFRFSINAQPVISHYEHATPPMVERVEAAAAVAKAGYHLGFIIAPIIQFSGWQIEYENLFQSLKKKILPHMREELTFELITHRFTKRAKNNILDLFPLTTLPMEEEERKFKYGQFGYGKYIYEKDTMSELKEYMEKKIREYFPQAKIEYFV